MKPVYQTVVDKDNGNCMQAALASLFELELEEVPNFVLWANSSEWYFRYTKFLEDKGYDVETVSCSKHVVSKEQVYKDLIGTTTIKGAIYCSVKSSMFEGGSHAVLINNNGIVIHDPNPNKFFLGKDIVITEDLISFERFLDIDYNIDTQGELDDKIFY